MGKTLGIITGYTEFCATHILEIMKSTKIKIEEFIFYRDVRGSSSHTQNIAIYSYTETVDAIVRQVPRRHETVTASAASILNMFECSVTINRDFANFLLP